MEINEIQREFVERTKKLLESSFEEVESINHYEVTFLLNCLLGLIVAVSEFDSRKKENKIFNKKIKDDSNFLAHIPSDIQYFDNTEVAIGSNYGRLHKRDYSVSEKNKEDLQTSDKKQDWYLKKIRNSIAHLNIEPENEGDKWIGVELYNEDQKMKDFSVVYKNTELKKFAIYIAGKYLENYQ
ncbi:HEPN family nuclease [uncultured Treponema sp.]|uniref:HEPN family nuclease n=1 Tax=uncultured Treponema sp. TaxID=162155 RepID=UPI0025DD4D33|nr:HEPN family nuclease [uncultured Treponema sp.]